jgi:hypothetical protein
VTNRSRGYIIVVNGNADANTERTKKAYKANQAKRKAACFQSYLPQGRYECVDSENLVKVYLYALGQTRPKNIRKTRRTMVIRAFPSIPN